MRVSEDLVSDVAEVLLTEEQIAAKVAELVRGSATTTPAAN